MNQCESQRIKKEYIEVTGIVQGVGFRPFVHNLAEKHNLAGYVLNNADGVVIEVEGAAANIETFLYDLEHTAPPLSRIVEIKRRVIDRNSQTSENETADGKFEIRDSVREGKPVALISPDTCVCSDCLKELFDTENRRHLYSFINCTNCGPRFTIIQNIPYDRPFTTMSGFTMCPSCRYEYENPRDRRFHAQPNACPVCGPHLQLLDSAGNQMPGDPLTNAIALLKKGSIVAVKGLGGFHLVVDGTNNDAVNRLRRRKHREEKPLAVMTGSIRDARGMVHMSAIEDRLLTGYERPILLARRHENTPVADAVAPGNDHLGVMLPYTPLHYLLFFHPDAGGNYFGDKSIFPALVMTSGNVSEEPICKDNADAIDRLAGIADAFLVHDRDIHVRSDDSVVRVADGEASFIRRSRGYVPVPVFLKKSLPSVLALGGELKNTLCITEGRHAFLSQHIGDMANISTFDYFHEAVEHFKKILELEPDIIAYDLHPEYQTTKYFNRIEGESGSNFGAVGVQHHHSHIAGVLAEHGCDDPVIGFSMDGTGYGLDGAIWGGEVLLCTGCNFTRCAHLEYVPMPGGESAVREAWRMAFSYLRESFGDDWKNLDASCLKQIPHQKLEMLEQACKSGVNSPKTSSLGRLFDAVSSILDLCQVSAYEGQAAIMLDMTASSEQEGKVLPYNIYEKKPEMFGNYPVLRGNLSNVNVPSAPTVSSTYILDYKPLVRSLIEGVQRGRSVSKLAYDFHTTLLASFLDVLGRISETTGVKTVAYSGGCWQNRILSERFPALLRENGYDVLTNNLVPPNDGGIALGQAYVAANIAELAQKKS